MAQYNLSIFDDLGLTSCYGEKKVILLVFSSCTSGEGSEEARGRILWSLANKVQHSAWSFTLPRQSPEF